MELLIKIYYIILFRVVYGVAVKTEDLDCTETSGVVRSSEPKTIFINTNVSFRYGTWCDTPIDFLLYHEWVHTLQWAEVRTTLDVPTRGAFHAQAYLYTDRDEAEAEAFAYIMTGKGLEVKTLEASKWLLDAYNAFNRVPEFRQHLHRGKLSKSCLKKQVTVLNLVKTWKEKIQENLWRIELGLNPKYTIPPGIEYVISKIED